MRAIFLAQVRLTIRSPWAFLIMVGLSIGMAFIFAFEATSTLPVNVIAEDGLAEGELDRLLESLNTSSVFEFEAAEEADVLERISGSATALAVRLGPDSWRVMGAETNESVPPLSAFVDRVYREDARLRDAAERAGSDVADLRQQVDAALQTPALRVETTNVASASEDSFTYDSKIQGAVGMSLFFAMFTIMFTVNNILEERRTGLWDRVVISPASKAAMYGGHVLFSFLTGLVQLLLVFGVFRFVFGLTFGSSTVSFLAILVAYALAITALGMLLAGLVANAQQMAVVIPIVSVSSAMLGGAYWPIEIVSSGFMQALAELVPIHHAMEGIKGLAYHGWSLAQALPTVGVLLLFAVVLGAVGLWRVEARGNR